MIQPMLAKLGTDKDLDHPDWLYEAKLDGIRCIAILDNETHLQARSGATITHKFPELAELARQVGKPCILDGELVGNNFSVIQHRIHQDNRLKIRIASTQYPATYYVFDILRLDNESLTSQPLIYRKAILESILISDCRVRLLDWQIGGGRSLFAQSAHLEGIMAKAINSPYLEGKRSDSWLKIKNFRTGTFYICGVTVGDNDRNSTFGSLILADKLEDGKLNYVGNVGSGFDASELAVMLSLLMAYRDECPFETKPDIDRPVKFWTRPELRCEVRYLEMSNDGKLRFPSFRGIKDGQG